MNVLDIILLVVLLIALVMGFRRGIIVQLCGIAGLFAGIWLALRFCRVVGEWLGMSDRAAAILGFVVIVVVAIVVLAIIGRLFRKVFHLTGLGVIDRIGGAVLGVVKMALILSVLLSLLVRVNNSEELFDRRIVDESRVYKPLRSLSDALFPYLVQAKDALFEEMPEDDGEQERAEERAEEQSI